MSAEPNPGGPRRSGFPFATPTAWPRWFKALVTSSFVLLVGMLAWSKLPDGAYPTDLSRLGDAGPTVVLAVDANYSGGMHVMDMLNRIRDDYAGRIDFRVAHLGQADGQAFAERHAVGDGDLVMVASGGRATGVMRRPESAEAIRSALREAFGI